MSGIGHNGGPTFDEIVQEHIDRGVLITIKEVIIEAVRDTRLERRHLRVLAEIVDTMNTRTAMAYPGRRGLSERTRMSDMKYDPERAVPGYTEGGVAKTISELIAFGYLVQSKRAAEQGGRALSHYTIRKPSVEELQDYITTFIMGQRSKAKADKWAPKKPDDTPSGNVTPVVVIRTADGTPLGNVVQPDVTPSGNVTPVGNVTSDVTPVAPTVTSRKELGENDYSAGAREGEEHKGHGIYVNGETIRHAKFAISLPGISLNTVASGLTGTEVKQRCLAHALQWAVEIENGGNPDKVIPSKVANFLARSIMSEVGQTKVQGVRERRAQNGYTGAPVSGQKIETQAERWLRLAGAPSSGDEQS